MLAASSALPGVQGQQSVHAAEPYTRARARRAKSETDWVRQSTRQLRSRSRTAGSRGRATSASWMRASSPARTAVTLLTGDRLAYRRRDLHDQRDGRRLRRHPAATPGIRLRSATRVDQGPLSGYDPRHLDMLTPDRPRRCRAQLACTVCAELQEAARSAVGSHAPVETPSRSSGVHAAATRRRPAGSAVSRTGHPAQARRCGKRVAGYPVGDGGSGAGVLSTRR